jgi:hypothetical protein
MSKEPVGRAAPFFPPATMLARKLARSAGEAELAVAVGKVWGVVGMARFSLAKADGLSSS